MIASRGECAKIWKRVVLDHVLRKVSLYGFLQAEKEPAEEVRSRKSAKLSPFLLAGVKVAVGTAVFKGLSVSFARPQSGDSSSRGRGQAKIVKKVYLGIWR
ncbi:hypothetical protein TNCV_2382341 [Trichonephila clavipes]|nr:hypothetical protein TNCV_2382341 [Trichonephila clavipes]